MSRSGTPVSGMVDRRFSAANGTNVSRTSAKSAPPCDLKRSDSDDEKERPNTGIGRRMQDRKFALSEWLQSWGRPHRSSDDGKAGPLLKLLSFMAAPCCRRLAIFTLECPVECGLARESHGNGDGRGIVVRFPQEVSCLPHAPSGTIAHRWLAHRCDKTFMQP